MSVSLRKEPVLYAHRGASIELPENTIEAFLRALAVGATAIETDVHMTHDGHVVISHDPTGERAAGVSKRIAAVTLSEVKSWDAGRKHIFREGTKRADRYSIPTLKEALIAVPDVPFNVDIKQHTEAAARAVVSVVREVGATARVLLTSFDAATIEHVRRLEYEGPTGLGQREVLRLMALPLAVLRVRKLKGRAAQIPVSVGPLRLDRKWLIDKAHQLGIEVHYWTINDPAEAKRLLALGADAIMTDDPERIAEVFSR